MQKYVTTFSFAPMTLLKAYVLGFAWADGAIDTPLNCLAFVSKDDLTPLRDVFYGPDRPVYRRKCGTYQLNVASRRIVQELVELGFTSQKSRRGSPTLPLGLEQYFLLGLLDGDGCVYSDSKTLKVFYCGNAVTMRLVHDTIGKLTEIRCFLCGVSVVRNGTTVRYRSDCRLLLRRQTNRRLDHENRDGHRSSFVDLLTDEEKKRIDLNALAYLG